MLGHCSGTLCIVEEVGKGRDRGWVGGRSSTMPRVDITENYYRCRQRDPKLFITFTSPEWANRIADSEIKGAKVIRGSLRKKVKVKGKLKYVWRVQSVLIPKKRGMNRERAAKAARRIKKKVEGR